VIEDEHAVSIVIDGPLKSKFADTTLDRKVE